MPTIRVCAACGALYRPPAIEQPRDASGLWTAAALASFMFLLAVVLS